jgi:hypothetical protein
LSQLDSSTLGFRAAVRYSISSPTTFMLTTIRQQARFGVSTRDNETVQVLPALLFAPFALINGRAEVGFLSFTPHDPTVPAFKGAVAHTDLGYVLHGVTRFGVQVMRDVIPAPDVKENYTVQTAVTGSITHRISERWDVAGTAARMHLGHGGSGVTLAPGTNADELAGAPTVNVSADMVVHTYTGTLGFYFNRGVRVGCRVEYVTRASALPINAYNNLRVMSFFNLRPQ